MKLTLKIAFNSRINGQVVIDNPVYVPVIGDVININAEDFFQEQKIINQLNTYGETGIWKVALKIVDYSKIKTTITIVLEEGS